MIHAAYIAGFIDADGCVSIRFNREKRSFGAAIIVVQKELRLLEMFKEEFGGILNTTHQNKSNRTYYRWYIQGKALTKLINQILPYIVDKKEQCMIALEATKHQEECGRGRYRKGSIGTQPLSKQDLNLRENLWLRNKELNTCHKIRAAAETKFNDPSDRDAIVRA